ncbi:MAG: TIR domain-containing protein, partial [Alphaproteobacteria bacterium 32-64-14]
KLEWQNALYAATKGKTRLIPVRVDGSPMPAILSQTLYIDMHTIGLEAALSQIVSVAQGNASFIPKHQGFSNLSCSVAIDQSGKLDVTIRASHLMEPNPNFMLLVSNPETELSWTAPGAPGFVGGFNKDIAKHNGLTFSGIVMRPMNATLTPAYPVRLQVTPRGAAKVQLHGVMHQVGETEWRPVPLSNEPGLNWIVSQQN